MMKNDDYIVRDHRVYDARMMPGVTYLDMIYRLLISKGFEHEKIELRNIIFKEPIITTSSYDKKIHMTFEESSDKWKAVSMSQKIKNNEILEENKAINFECDVLIDNNDILNKRINIQELKNCAISELDMDKAYGYARNVQINHYEFMKGLGRIYEGETYLLAELWLSSLAQDYLDYFFLHPAFLDASTIVLGIKSVFGTINGKPSIPMYIESFRAVKGLKSKCFVYIPLNKLEAVTSGDITYFDIELYDEDGQICAEFKRLAIKQIRSKELIKNIEQYAPEKKMIRECGVKPPIRGTLEEAHKPPETLQPCCHQRWQQNLNSKDFILNDLKQIVANILDKDPKLISLDTDFFELGLDSAQLLKIENDLEKKLKCHLYPTLLFEYPNISELANYLENKNIYEKLSTEPRFSNIDYYDAIKPQTYNEAAAIKPQIYNEDIAIIGISGSYPMAKDIQTLWENLKSGKNCITEIPQDRWDYRLYFNENKGKIGKSYSRWGGFLNDIDKFDPLFFNISPKEADLMDPQERLFLETVWHTVEDSGYTRYSLSDNKVGVFVGVMYGQYQLLGNQQSQYDDLLLPLPSYASIANRVSYYFNFRGPSMAVDTMCSSSLTAIHLACESIKRGETDVAIAGGVNLSLHPSKYIILSQLNLISSGEKSCSFGKGGDGYVPGEGVGAVLLKSINNAIKDQDCIYAVIKGSSLNHGGKANRYTVPNPNAQANLILDVLDKANVDPRTIGYIEAQAVGSALGDPIEITALAKSFGKYIKGKNYCPIGSIKSNIGHLEAASGIAGLTKLILQMKYKKLVPSINSENLNPNIDFENSPFYVQHQLEEWKQPFIDGKLYPRRAGISSFGATGANAHLILEEYANLDVRGERLGEEKENIIVLSAKNEDRLKEYAKKFLLFLDSNKNVSFDDVAYTLQIGREEMDERLAIVALNAKSLSESLRNFIENMIDPNVYYGNVKNPEKLLFDIMDGMNGKSLIKLLLENNDVLKIANLWISGIEIDWKLLYKNNFPRRISLPTYSFEQKRCWLNSGNEVKSNFDDKFSKIMSKLNELPTNEQIEEVLKQIISEYLKISVSLVKSDEPLEAYGFDSLTGLRLVSDLKNIYGDKISIKQFYELPNIKSIAKYLIDESIIDKDNIKNMLKILTGEDKVTVLLSEKSQTKEPSPCLPNDRITYPLSEQQKALWIIYNSEPENFAYNCPIAFGISRDTDIEILKQTFQYMINRHPVLKTVIHMVNGESHQTILENQESCFIQKDLESLSDAYILGKIKEESRKPFDLENGPLAKITLFSTPSKDYIMLMNFHHIIFDGTSAAIFIQEFQKCYFSIKNRTRLDDSSIKSTYSDFVYWQKDMLRSEKRTIARDYWLKKLPDEIPVLDLNFGNPQTKVRKYQGESITKKINPNLTRQIKEFSQNKNAKLFVTMLTAYNVLLYRYTNQEDILIGLPFLGRPSNKYNEAIGYFVNMVVVICNLSGEISFESLLRQIKENVAQSFEYCDYPLTTLIEDLREIKKYKGAEPFQVGFAFQNWFKNIRGTLFLEELDNIHQDGEFNLALEVTEKGNELFIRFKYNPDMFDEATISRMSDHYIQILNSAIESFEKPICEIDMLTKKEQYKILFEFNNTKSDYAKDKTINQLFEEQVEKTPDNIAVVFENKNLTYKELNEKANQLARVLRSLGVEPDSIVGIMVEKSIEMIVGIIGILKAGGAYLPIDPEYPEDRIKFILEDSKVNIILSNIEIKFDLDANSKIIDLNDSNIYTGDSSNLKPKVTPNNLAYIIFTSGSTGKPKGVMIEHIGISNLKTFFKNKFGVTHTDRIIQFASISFDASVWESFMALLTGASLYIVPSHVINDFDNFTNFLNVNNITIITLPPTYLLNLDPNKINCLRKLIVAGSASNYDLFTKWKDKTSYINAYGPTESTICATFWDSSIDTRYENKVPIGTPVNNFKAYILDKNNSLLPLGVPGNLCISGDGLARSYLNRPDISREKFVPDPFIPGERMYLTGDLARWLPDGNIEFIGRTDNQVKIRGFRIELGEIEAELLKCDSIKEAVVLAKENVEGSKYLCAYIVSEGHGGGKDTGGDMGTGSLSLYRDKEPVPMSLPPCPSLGSSPILSE